ncbi:S-adenosyl-L-methionine-dependent methyltransferase [Sphaerosporella brunnea]|uniref:S-adenosyl-L-methionine-dependent methyltransferase n=1 Tax=Sphaerosporella brunnea TaxID=1250544 RepID=A0A5J5EMI2_9PEZI|nr:S-adenosyl-L-methionine-dependent methyltransferase [Sphaerosporella brunnea]
MANRAPIYEVDPEMNDEFELGYESSGSAELSTVSLSNSVNEYLIENGRRYHSYFGTDKNPLPTDEIEQDRLDMHHEAMLLMQGGAMHLAPVEDPQRILDVGTGTGIWAIEMADRHPKAKVIGIDLSPIQPKWVPPNCHFRVDDAEYDWDFKHDYFDFIYMRNLAQGISNWPRLLQQAYRSTKPGGYAEIADVGCEVFSDESVLPDAHPVKRFFTCLEEAMCRIGRPPQMEQSMRKYLEDAGFVDVVIKTMKQPLGPWPQEQRMREIGSLMYLNCETGFHAYGMAAFTRVLGMTTEEADTLCTESSRSIRERTTRVYNLFHVAYGRKPRTSNLRCG